MNWKLKLLAQKCIYLMPEKLRIRLLSTMQYRYGQVGHIDINACQNKIRRILSMISLMRLKSGSALANKSVVEIGTGWDGAAAICFWLAGANRIITTDVVRHLDVKIMRKIVRDAYEMLDEIAERSGERVKDVIARHTILSSCIELSDFQKFCNIHYCAPATLSACDIVAGSIDVVYSSSVLQRLTLSELSSELSVARRILNENGVSIHLIHHSDHNARHDKNLNKLEYLKYPEWLYDCLQTPRVNYQNRLRSCEFIEVFSQQGFELVDIVREYADSELIKAIKVNSKYQRFSLDELRCVKSEALFKARQT